MSSRIWRRGRFVENVSGTVVFLITILFFDFRRVRDSVRFELPFPVNMTAEQFCLRWNNHQRTLISVFDGLFESGTLVDCTLAADGQYLKAHKVVLCACSPYLEALLSQHYNQHPIVILKDVKFEELQAIMEYMYRGEVNVTQEQLGHFLKAAEMLQVKGLTYSENKPGGASAQIVSSKFSAAGSDSDKNASVVKPHESKKKEKVTLSPATGSQSSLVDSLKLLPSKLVIDIPPISPVNNAKDGSVSPKRKKLSYSGEVKSSSPGNKNSESAANDQSSSSSSSLSAAAAGKSKFVFEVDPMETEFNAQNIKVEEFSDDSYDSDTLVVDEDNAADGKQQEPGPSGAVADGWKALVAQGDDHPEATKDLGTLAAAMALTRSTATLRAIASFDALRERERPFVCDRCGRHYSVSYTLDRHKKYECGVDKQFFCRKCYRPFSRADSMRVHMRNCLAKRTPSTSTSPNDDARREDYL